MKIRCYDCEKMDKNGYCSVTHDYLVTGYNKFYASLICQFNSDNKTKGES